MIHSLQRLEKYTLSWVRDNKKYCKHVDATFHIKSQQETVCIFQTFKVKEYFWVSFQNFTVQLTVKNKFETLSHKIASEHQIFFVKIRARTHTLES